MPPELAERWSRARLARRGGRCAAAFCLATALAMAIAACDRSMPTVRPARTPLATAERFDAALPVSVARPADAVAAYAEYCARCHGVAGDGDGFLAATLDPKPTNFRSPDRRDAPLRARRAIARGVTGSSMKRFDHVLDDQAQWDMAFLVWSLAEQPADLARGAALHAARCAGCHGAPSASGAVRLDDPARAAQAPADVARALRARHAREGLLGDRADEAALVAYLYTFLYEPPGRLPAGEAIGVSTSGKTH